MRLGATKASATTSYNGLGDQLYDLGGARPTLDLNFSSNESLVDSVTGKTLVDHTRQSSATYVDGDGVIRTAVTNLLLRSEEFDNADWPKIRCSVTPNATLAPNNTFTADAIVEDTSNNTHILQADGNTTAVNGTTYTYSWYLKAGERTALRIAFGTDFGVWQNETLEIDLSDGTLSNVSGFTTTPTVENVGNGWYRLSTTVTAQASAGGVLRMTPLVGGVISYTGDGTSKYFIWGAQLEESSTVGQYVKTTTAINSAPRFDHNPTTGESLGLLVEESRTNLVSNSEDTTEWSVNGAVNITANNATAPDNTTTADKLENVSNVFDGLYAVVSISTSTTYTVSGFIKAVDQPRSRLGVLHTADAWFGYVDTDWDASGTPSTQGSSGASNITYENYGNNWYRVSFDFTSPASISSGETRFMVQPDRTNTQQSIYFWGAQLEAGSFPTSYIRTTGSTVTRSADVTSITGTNFSSWYNQTEGTVFSASRHKAVTARTLAFTDGTASNAMQQYLLASSAAMDSYVSGTWQGSGSVSTTFTSDQQFKVVSTIQTNSGVTAVDGTLGTVDTSYGIPTVDRLLIGQSRSSDNTNGTISRLTYWPTRLSNDTLETITV